MPPSLNWQSAARALRCAALLALAPLAALAQTNRPAPATAQPEFVDIGVQPNTSSHYIAAAMQHDRVLHAALRQSGLRLRSFPFKKGTDMAGLLDGSRLEAAFLGNLPATQALITHPTFVVGLATQNYCAVVAQSSTQLHNLRGKKIAYPAATSAHLGLLRALEAAQLNAADVQLVPMDVALMPEALAAGRIDAFSAWEPTPSTALSREAGNRLLHRSISTHWLLLSQAFAQQQPQAALALTSAYVRAIYWMRQKSEHLAQATRWVQSDATAFNGHPTTLDPAKAMALARKELLDVPGMPLLPRQIEGAPPLLRELSFLHKQGLLRTATAESTRGTGTSIHTSTTPTPDTEARVRSAFHHALLTTVLTAPERHQLHTFNYSAEAAP